MDTQFWIELESNMVEQTVIKGFFFECSVKKKLEKQSSQTCLVLVVRKFVSTFKESEKSYLLIQDKFQHLAALLHPHTLAEEGISSRT